MKKRDFFHKYAIGDFLKLVDNHPYFTERDKGILKDHFSGVPYEETANRLSLSAATIRDIALKRQIRFIRHLKNAQRHSEEITGVQNNVWKLEEEVKFLNHQIRLLSMNVNATNSENLNFTLIEDCGFTMNAYNCLKSNKCNTIADIVTKSPSELLRFRNLGKKTLCHIQDVLRVGFGIKYGLS